MGFGVKKYADALWNIVKGRGINVHLRQHLVEIKPETKEAVFENLDNNELTTVPYDMIHITPPMATPEVLSSNKDLSDASGFLSVDKETLQHTKYPNIFGIGDCTNIPVAKTAAAVAAQLGIMRRNLGAAIKGSSSLPAAYTGYTSCPLVTGKGEVEHVPVEGSLHACSVLAWACQRLVGGTRNIQEDLLVWQSLRVTTDMSSGSCLHDCQHFSL